MSEAPLVVRDRRFREHVAPPQHPERPERLDAIDAALEPMAGRLREVDPRPASDEEILRAHGREHLEALQRHVGARARIDADTYLSPRSLEVARLAAGGAIELALRVARGEARSGFALVRPPGHHAERAHAMGFCLFNNVALAARALVADEGVERIAIVDWDVHHGNGTQALFEEERDVLFVSLHQFPLYPGTGAMNEMGRDAGLGSTVNLPLPAGCGDSEYGAVFEATVAPILREFRPELLLVSAGFDAHLRDPLAGMRLTGAGFASLAALARGVADDVCGGRIALVLEGGYDLQALGESVRAVLEVLAMPSTPDPALPFPTREASGLVELFREAQEARWRSLRRTVRG